ncbi:MAG TPA: LLM class flavin-dependent oxidoreductase, partial [Acidimicrobiales bacterium]|nr:LLM class flavin-dependent oxidoreductase [Acidimicrobiales bacterium]
HASGGRFQLGIGWGPGPAELTTFGVAPTEPRDRVARLGESLAILRGLWSGEPVDHAGEHFTLDGAQQRPTPTRPIPVTIGGVGRRTLGLVRAHADWWNVPIHQLDRVDELRDQAGEARLSVQTMVAFSPDAASREEVAATARRRFAGTQMGERLVAGTADELAAHFTEQHAGGVDRFYVWFADFAPVDTVAGFGAVIAALS